MRFCKHTAYFWRGVKVDRSHEVTWSQRVAFQLQTYFHLRGSGEEARYSREKVGVIWHGLFTKISIYNAKQISEIRRALRPQR